jgi:phage-related protein
MIDRTKRLPARFYETVNGKIPVRKWLLDLDEADRRSVGKDIAKVEFGWPIGLMSCRPIFAITDGSMVLLHAFIKKTQATPKSDLDLARKRRKEVV